MTAETFSPEELTRLWHQVIGARRRCGHELPRDFAALGYLTCGPVTNNLIELHRLLFVVLYDEREPGERPALRLTGFRAERIPHGVRIGGEGNCRIRKNLALRPKPDAKGPRPDLDNSKFLELGLQLERRIQSVMRMRHRPLPTLPKLPRLWAAFNPTDAHAVCGDGPEFQQFLEKFGFEPEALLAKFRREHLGLSLFPLDWVSHRASSAVAIYADLEGYSQVRVFRLREEADGLCGYEGAVEFDFLTYTGAEWLKPRLSQPLTAQAA
jgi:hypothetical protein